MEGACDLKVASERRQHFCNVCNVALELQDAEKIHLKGHDVGHGFKSVYCNMTE